MGVSIRPEIPPQRRRTRLEELAGVTDTTETEQPPRGEGLSNLERLAAGLPVEGEKETDLLGSVKAFGAGLLKGIPFADELYGIMALRNPAVAKKGIVEGARSAGETAEQFLDEQTEGHGVANVAGQVASGLALPLGAASKATSLGGKMLAGAGSGALWGGLAGAGEGEGLQERAENAMKGTAIGAGVGGAAAPVVAGASRLGRGLLDVSGMRPRSGAPGTATAPRTGAIGDIAEQVTPRSDAQRAADKLLEALEDDRFTPEQIRTEVASRAARPKPETINELAGENVRGLTETAATIPGPTKELLESRLVTGRIGERLGDDNPILGRVRGDTERALGLKAGSTLEAVDDILTTRATEAAPHYDKAFKAGGVIDERIPALLKRPSVTRAIKYARELAEESGDELALPDVGAPIDIRTLHHIKLALDDALYLARKAQPASVTESATGPTKLRAIAETRAQIKEILHSNPDYKAGAESFAGHSALKDAIEQGDEMFSASGVRAEDVRRAMRDMTESERTMFLQGAANALHRVVGDVKDARNIVEKVAGTPNLREKMQSVLGKNYDEWITDMKREDAIYGTRNDALRGSQTARREAGKERLSELGRTKPGEYFKPTYWGGRAVEGIRNRQVDMMAESLGPLLTAGTQGAEMSMDDLLRELVAAESRRTAQASRQAATAGKAGRVAGQQGTKKR